MIEQNTAICRPSGGHSPGCCVASHTEPRQDQLLASAALPENSKKNQLPNLLIKKNESMCLRRCHKNVTSLIFVPVFMKTVVNLLFLSSPTA